MRAVELKTVDRAVAVLTNEETLRREISNILVSTFDKRNEWTIT